MVILSHWSLALKHLNQDSWLIVSIGGENLRFLGRNCSVSRNEVGHNTSCSFNTEREGSNIKEKEVFNILITFTSENGCLDCSTISNSFIRVDGTIENFTIEEVLEHLLDFGNSSRTTNKDNLVDLTFS
jgi:hypothetical protein